MSFTLQLNFDQIDGAPPTQPLSAMIQPMRAARSSDGGVARHGTKVALSLGAATITLPDATQESGNAFRVICPGWPDVVVPAQPAGSTVALSDYIDQTAGVSLPSTIETRLAALEAGGGGGGGANFTDNGDGTITLT